MRSRLGRLCMVAVSLALAAATALTLVRLGSPSALPSESSASTRSSLVVDVTRPAWYGLRVLHRHLSFHVEGIPATPPPPMKVRAGILVDLDTHRILWQLDPHLRLPPASTIKLLSALVVLENFSPDRLLTVTPDALFQAWDESRMFLHAGQTLSVRELLSGMLMVSANDAADTLAVDTVGLEKFVGAMDAQAAALGLRDTHATTPVGLDDPAMYSSAYDLAVLAAVDLQFPLFGSIVDTRHLLLPGSPLHPAFFLSNINLLLAMYPPAMGVKTGYTARAGGCEVGLAVRDGHRLLSVLLNGGLIYSQTRRLLDWGFTVEGLPSQLPSPSPSPSPSATPHH